MRLFRLTMGIIGIILAVEYFMNGEYVKTAVAALCTVIQFWGLFQEEQMNEEKKMDPETAIKVLKVLNKWILQQSAVTNNDIETRHALDEAIQIAVTALEEKIGG